MIDNEEKKSSRLAQCGRLIVTLIGRSLRPNIMKIRDIKKIKDAYQLPVSHGEAFLFDYAVFVFWDVPEQERQRLSKIVKPYVDAPVNSIIDSYSYTIDKSKSFNIARDNINLSEDASLIRLALSHAFAQSIKLAFFETKAESVIAANLDLPKRLAQTGRTRLSRKKLAKLRGELFDTRCDITLNFNLLDKPSFFWEFLALDSFYEALSHYLEITPRIELLNHKLSMIHDFLEMLAEEQHQKHSINLEWVIIILIAFEVLLFFFRK